MDYSYSLPFTQLASVLIIKFLLFIFQNPLPSMMFTELESIIFMLEAVASNLCWKADHEWWC